MTLNIELLDKTLAAVKEAAERRDESTSPGAGWVQQDWRCRSGMCFAGFAAELAGGKWVNPVAKGQYEDSLLVADPTIDKPHQIALHYGSPVPSVTAADRARNVLGFTAGSAGLFAGGNKIEDLERIVAELKVEDAAMADAENAS